jgi:hypothetical protein
MVAQKGEIARSRSLLMELFGQFRGWGIPVWQQKCEQELEDQSDFG